MAGNLRFFWKLMKTNVAQSTSLKLNFLFETLFMVANDILYFMVWIILFAAFQEINGWGIRHVMLMEAIAVTSYAIYAFCFRGVADTLAGYIERGELDTFILQPRNILVNVAGSRSNPAAMGDLLCGLVLFVWSGFVTFQNFPIVLLSILAGFLAFFSIGIIIGSLAFYMKDVEGWGQQIMNIFLHLTMQPGSIYTGWTRMFLMFVLPAGIISFMTVEAITEPGISTILTMLGVTAAFFLVAVWFFYRGIRRYESGNAFGVRG